MSKRLSGLAYDQALRPKVLPAGKFYVRVEIVDTNNGTVVGSSSCGLISDTSEVGIADAKASASIAIEDAFRSALDKV